MDQAFKQAFETQRRIVWALILQDMSTRYARSHFGALTAVIEPVLIVIGTYIIRFYLQGVRSVEGIPMVLFLVTGFMTDFCFRIVTGNVISSAERNTPSRMFPQVTSLDVILARGISGSAVSGGAMLVSFVLGALMTGRPPNDILFCWIAGVFTFGLAVPTGIVMGVVVRRYPTARTFVSLFLRINFVLSGAMFLGTELPPRMIPYVSWNPTFHIVELMREGWFRNYVSPFASPTYVMIWITGLLAIGLPLERLTGNRRSR